MDFTQYLPKDKTQRMYAVIGLGVLGVLILVGLGWGLWAVLHSTQTQDLVNSTNAVSDENIPTNAERTPAITIGARHLDGMMVATAQTNDWPICLMIENAAFDGVRPQAGLSRALVVYEVIVEGGITRLMGVFGGEPISKIGPVRSARDTYIEFVSELDCIYGYAGGSFTATQATQQLDLHTLNALSSDGKYYWRDSSLYAPHNLFTSWDLLLLAIRDKQLNTPDPTFDTWTFRDQPKELEKDAVLAQQVNIDFSSPSYAVRWVYNQEQGYYERYNGGVLQTDRETGDTLTARNVIVERVPPGEEIEGKGRINFSVTGEGEVLIFRSGEVVTGTWKKANRISRTQFFDDQGKSIELNRGNSWVEIVPTDRTVSY